MALSFIGKPISLISHSDVRYRGILAGIDPAASTIQLSNVFSMGTESRRPPAEFIPPVQEPYQYIIFRASEVKDLAVDEPAPRRSVHDDPAVLGASAPSANPGFAPYGPGPGGPVPPYPAPGPAPAQQSPQTYPNRGPPPPQAQSSQASPQVPSSVPAATAAAAAPPTGATPNTAAGSTPPRSQQPHSRRTNSIHTAAASLETVERALGDLRVSSANTSGNHHTGGRGGRRGGGAGRDRDGGTKEIKVPATDFDFQSSNAKFDKAALAPRRQQREKSASTDGDEAAREGDDEVTNPSDVEGDKAKEQKEKEKEKGAYNPQKSFFDSLSSSTHGPPGGGGNGPRGGHGGNGNGGGRRGGGGGAGRNRREEERERNVATFGEPGGVGLMGPGAYVGGWGGYGRRGGRPRRGGAVGSGPGVQATTPGVVGR